MLSNLPDDWNTFYSRCGDCGRKWHASEGGCSHCEHCQGLGCGELLTGDNVSPFDGELCRSCGVEECEDCGKDVARGILDDDGACPACVTEEKT